MSLGVDYSTGPPRADRIRAAGFSAAFRYLSPPPNRKNLTKPEADSLRAAGLDIVMVWESTAARALAGRAAGFADGARAKALGEACGAPSSAALYLAVDFDPSAAQLPSIDDYRRGFATGISPHPVGVYGGLAICDYEATRGVGFRWQTAAWSRGRRHAGAAAYQRVQQVKVDGITCDVNEILGPLGGWSSPTAAPTPIPTPLPPALTGPEEDTMLQPLQFPPLASGAGFWDADGLPVDPATGKATQGYPRPLIPWERFRAVTLNGDGGAPPVGAAVWVDNFGGHIRVGVSGLAANAAPLVWLTLTPST